LKLPLDKKPNNFENEDSYSFLKHLDKFIEQDNKSKKSKLNLNNQTCAVGTTDCSYSSGTSGGLWETIFDAWANHWNIRISPEDFWLPIITKIATKIDSCANEESVNKYFRNGKEGKETITIQVDSFSIYDTNYNYLFNQFSKEIDKRIEVKNYVSTISSDFSTSTPDQLIGSQITIMKSFQKYFDYEMMIMGCGIKGLEMLGDEKDWKNLLTKLQSIIKLLEPIEKILRLKEYLNTCEDVLKNLLKTYNGVDMSKWWMEILIEGKDMEYGGSGMSIGETDSYNGWLVKFLIQRDYVLAKDMEKGKYNDQLNCISTAPMRIVDVINKVKDDSTLFAGILGYKVHTKTFNDVISLQAFHGWGLCLPKDSPLRKSSKNEKI